ncbi:glutathione-regulated potassium-efflux system protein [Nitzschia inconspicua]|uniref:Glutathione-regulated potassium-efflux system protein n=1 Tax=Nitzschia inconspicua TaxID=303405 RepID=A0A9K3Q310_9STRA|nr:glutathione-regulated potassium-efflux system protein [Nitzschia inconspicua]
MLLLVLLQLTIHSYTVHSFTPSSASSHPTATQSSRLLPFSSSHHHLINLPKHFACRNNSLKRCNHSNDRSHPMRDTRLKLMDSMDISSAPISIDSIHLAITSFSHSFSHYLIADATQSLTQLSPPATGMEGSLGRDIFTFLVASVVVVPLCKSLNITPVLGFLLVGCIIGPYGMQMFSNTETDIQLGDFGILFLLFNEGLSLSPERIKELGRFTGLGVFQLLISIGCLFLGSVLGGPILIRYIQEIGLPLDLKILRPIFENPVKAFVIASAGALSSSAFVLPFLKQKGWEERPEGIAGLSILLLQDLAVAPLLVVLPILAGSGPQSAAELSVLVFKATIGFGAVLGAGSFFLRYVFDIVAAARSTETFVAAALLVAVGMGQVADILGLSASTGAFAAGVLLAGNRYRAQIQADIKPFEGILLGIFFMTAGANLDPAVVIQEWPTLLAGIVVFIAVKAGIIFAAGPTLGLTKGQAARVALTLSGGGEFAFVLFQLAEDLGVLQTSLAKILVASVIISMSLTPILGEIGSYAANIIESQGVRSDGLTLKEEIELFDKIDINDSGTIDLDELRVALVNLDFSFTSIAEIFASFDTNGDGLICRDEWRTGVESGLLSEACERGGNDFLTPNTCFTDDAIIIVGFGEVGQELYSMLKTSGAKNPSCSNVVCFDLNPSRVLMGTMNGAPVIFGDGARMELLKAAGVKKPKAVIVTYASDDRRLDATMRLRAALPEGTPIYVYEGNSRIEQQLMEAGATEVINDAVETSLRFASLVGACQTTDQISRLRRLSMNHINMLPTSGFEESGIPGLSAEAVADLSEELGCSRKDIDELYQKFVAAAGRKDTIPIPELTEILMRQSSEGPSDGSDFESCLQLHDQDGEGMITFTQYLRATWSTECKM